MSISIIIPAYNIEDNIYTTLNSLLNQTDNDFELIIVNDGSTDNTAVVAEDLLVKSCFNNYKIINQQNRGVSSARNRGIREAKGEYIFFIDGDDYVSKDMMCIIKSYINNKAPDIIAWGYNLVDADKLLISRYFDLYEYGLTTMTGIEALQNIIIETNKLWICTLSAIYKKDLILENNLLYTEGCLNGEDQEFTFKVLSMAKEVCFINEILSFYVQREGSISNSFNIRKFDAVDAMERAAEYIRNNVKGEDRNIAKYIEYNKVIDNYISNFYSCYRNLIKEKRRFAFSNTKYLKDEIEKEYPGLNKSIKSKMKRFKSTDLKTTIKYKIFSINPFFYINTINIKSRFKNKKKVL